jgi:hypothetical protein
MFEVKRPVPGRVPRTHVFSDTAERPRIQVSRIRVSSVQMSKSLHIQILLTVSVEQFRPHRNNSPADQPTAEQPSLNCPAVIQGASALSTSKEHWSTATWPIAVVPQ